MVIVVMIQLMYFLFPFDAVMELFSSIFSFSLNLSLMDGRSQSLICQIFLCHFMFLCSFSSVIIIYIILVKVLVIHIPLISNISFSTLAHLILFILIENGQF